MLHKEIMELFRHFRSLEKDVHELHQYNTFLYRDLCTFQAQLDEGLKDLKAVHSGSNCDQQQQSALEQVNQTFAETTCQQIQGLEDEVNGLVKENQVIREELKDTIATLYTLQVQIDPLTALLMVSPLRGRTVHFKEPRSISGLSLGSQAHSSGNESYHSYVEDDAAQRSVPRNIMMTEAVLESSGFRNPSAWKHTTQKVYGRRWIQPCD
ncbi:hypothetical protein DSO57_1028782 [Entomophthora muscae]|uniref:Uncharacterized protein n=1 Tax=Entomophthora muscae TaxID=34485 RepID=A0ACC2TCV0_9FUNG|nr:hypothetical protein DSO57_1028782 [Entomophthora muscae]